VFCVDLRTNSDYFPVQHYLTGLYNRDGVFTARYGLSLYEPEIYIYIYIWLTLVFAFTKRRSATDFVPTQRYIPCNNNNNNNNNAGDVPSTGRSRATRRTLADHDGPMDQWKQKSPCLSRTKQPNFVQLGSAAVKCTPPVSWQ
jgi:hypothetical protein